MTMSVTQEPMLYYAGNSYIMNILITSASRKVSLVKAFRRALSEEGSGQVVAIDANPRSAALYFADKAYIVPAGLDKEFLKTVQNICIKHEIKLVIPTRDEELPFFAENRKSLEDVGVCVMVSSLDAVKLCQDKALFVEFCLKHGLSVPKTYKPADLFDFPVFVKSRFGKGSKGAFRANSRSELDCILGRLKDPVIQECIEAPEYTIDLFADFSGKVISVVPRERLTIFGGESFIGRTCKNWNIINESIRLAEALNLIGHNTIQCFLHNGQVKFIEVNPRYGGAANLGFAAGAFTPRMLIRLVLGKEVKPCIGDFKEGLYMLRYTEDLFVDEVKMKQINRFAE